MSLGDIMNLTNKQLQTLTQTQKMTLKQQYHLKLLSYNDQQLLSEIEHQVEINPLLECDESFFQINRNTQDSFYDQSLRYVHDEKTLQDDLLEQCHTYPEFINNSLATYLIESLDDDGYLRISNEVISQDSGYSEEEIEDTIAILQTFEPIGVCARNLQESLLIQLCYETPSPNKVALHIVNDYLDLLALNKLQTIADQLHLVLNEVLEAVTLIRSLQPKPASQYGQASAYVFPEATISVENQETFITLTNATIPISINHTYEHSEDLILQAYVKKHTKQAQILLDGLQKRNETFATILQYIVQYQRKFFIENGQLKPLTLQQVAQSIEMHESTISRCVSSKSLEFNNQVYPLKFFFPKQIESGQSSNEIQLRMKDMITKEDKHKPLSDQQMVDILKSENILVSRRAIAKYRDQLQIPAASKRKLF